MHFGEFCRLGFDYIVQSVYLRWGWQQRWFTNLLIFLPGDQLQYSAGGGGGVVGEGGVLASCTHCCFRLSQKSKGHHWGMVHA